MYDHGTLSTTSYLGKSCFEVTCDGTLWAFFDIVFNQFTIGSKIQATLDIFTENSIVINIYKYGGTNQNIMLSTVTVPSSHSWGTYTISSNEIPSDANSVRIRLLQSTSTAGTKTYVTNCILKII